jgi:hypothetical protein
MNKLSRGAGLRAQFLSAVAVAVQMGGCGGGAPAKAKADGGATGGAGGTGAVQVIADSVTDFSGVQGDNHWFYGYIEPTSSTQFVELTRFGIFSPYWPGEEFWFLDANRYWTAIGALLMHPNGTVSAGLPSGAAGTDALTEQWPVRRWVSSVSGEISIAATARKRPAATCGNGLDVRIAIDGTTAWSKFIAATDSVGFSETIKAQVGNGSTVDFVVDPHGGDHLCDHTDFSAVISH